MTVINCTLYKSHLIKVLDFLYWQVCLKIFTQINISINLSRDDTLDTIRKFSVLKVTSFKACQGHSTNHSAWFSTLSFFNPCFPMTFRIPNLMENSCQPNCFCFLLTFLSFEGLTISVWHQEEKPVNSASGLMTPIGQICRLCQVIEGRCWHHLEKRFSLLSWQRLCRREMVSVQHENKQKSR